MLSCIGMILKFFDDKGKIIYTKIKYQESYYTYDSKMYEFETEEGNLYSIPDSPTLCDDVKYKVCIFDEYGFYKFIAIQ